MKRKIAKLVALLLVFTAVFTLTACKKTTGGASSSSSAEAVPDNGLDGLIDYSSSFDLITVETIVDDKGEPYVTPVYHMRDKTITFLSSWNAETPDLVHMVRYMENTAARI